MSRRRYNGHLRGLEGADRKCQRLATAAGLPGTYKAWLTNRHTTPQERFTHSAVPYVTVTGVVIADDFADLADFILDAPFIVTEQGGVPPLDTTGCPGPADNFATFNVWTGSKPYNCGGWTLSEGGEGVWGYPELPDSWAGVCHGGDCDWLAPIYCFQQ